MFVKVPVQYIKKLVHANSFVISKVIVHVPLMWESTFGAFHTRIKLNQDEVLFQAKSEFDIVIAFNHGFKVILLEKNQVEDKVVETQFTNKLEDKFASDITQVNVTEFVYKFCKLWCDNDENTGDILS